MNLIEALKTGKRFRRPNWGIYYSASQEEFFELTATDVLAEDWEVEQIKVTLTSEAFDNAVRKVEVKLHRLPYLSPVLISNLLKELKEELRL